MVDLEPSELDLRKQIRRAFQQTLRKCQGLGYTVRMVSLVEVLDTFLELYKQTMDRVQAKESYYFDRDYFLSLARLPGVHCCVIESGSTVLSASVFFERNGIVNTHLGGTHIEYLSKSPGIMAMFEVMLWCRSSTSTNCHPEDATIRPQIVTRESNVSYHRVLEEFHKGTGRGTILNTSLNIHGEPIVSSPDDAVSVMQRSGLHHLALGYYLISKPAVQKLS
ncbi:MAG: GNAT family N-acetyltransferase [Pirellula sp.]|nr:GNAT family N-acetyltransferase [Pirellula sp.]